jgi:hypothetical protein
MSLTQATPALPSCPPSVDDLRHDPEVIVAKFSDSEPPSCPPSVDDLRHQLHLRLDQIIEACLSQHANSSFLDFETALLDLLASLGRLLLQLFLLARHQQLDVSSWLQDKRYRPADPYAPRTLKTACGPVRYGRVYLASRQGPGIHPLDIALGLTRDAFSPLLIGWFCRLATRLSFRLASELGGMFLSHKPPPPSAVEEWVLGLGRPAYLWHQSGPLPKDEGEVLVVECDGKAAPTATEEELAKRRGKRPRHGKACVCGCQRHRGRRRRQRRGRKPKRQRGDKSKNGRSAVLVVMYTLKRGADGRLHGPCNKKVYATFSSRQTALAWARQQATRRGFAADTDKTVQIVIDGELCLEQQLKQLFPRAIVTLDVRHAQERLWRVGRLFHAEGSSALASWVEPLTALLYQGKVEAVLARLQQAQQQRVGPGSKAKRQTIAKAIGYLQKRQGLMNYGEWSKQDLVLASGVVEGAARYVIGERLDQSGMRWTVEKAESLLQLRCIEVNGDWESFFAWAQEQRSKALAEGQAVQIRSKKPTVVPESLPASERRRQRRRKKAGELTLPEEVAA